MAAIHDRAVRLNLSFRHVDHRDMGKKKWHLLCDRILLGGESGHQEEESQRKENDPAHKILRGCLAQKITGYHQSQEYTEECMDDQDALAATHG